MNRKENEEKIKKVLSLAIDICDNRKIDSLCTTWIGVIASDNKNRNEVYALMDRVCTLLDI